jgi:hypothetical protein
MDSKESWQSYQDRIYDVSVLENSGLLPEATSLFDSLQSGRLGFTTAGEDHDVLILPYKAVVKRPKPTSREGLVWGAGVALDDVRDIQRGNKPRPRNLDDINWEQVLSYAHQAHGAFTGYFGPNRFVPTIFVLYDRRAFRVQPYKEGSEDDFAKQQIKRFYMNMLFEWTDFLTSSQFRALPRIVQSFYEYFPLDDGGLSNAFFYSVGIEPQIKDY